MIILIFLVGGLILACILVYMYYRRLLREAKNYERGLKMVTLMIHLPPSSDDIESGGRDTRDITDETISKAQVLYNILSSTAQDEKFKVRLYGQRHVGFEIIAKKGMVRFYAAVPVAMISVVEQAIVSAYPNSRVEEVPEHNIFSQVGKLTGTIGGELDLKENFAQPFATYQETKRDGLQAIINALSSLEADDGAAIQMLIRPAQRQWSKQALDMASDKRDNKTNKTGAAAAGTLAKDVASALWKAPESKDKPDQMPDKKLSSLEQAHIEAIEDKTRHPAFETLIRIVASSNVATRSQSILNNIVASLALFDAPGKNGLKFSPAKDMESFITAFIFRFFPQDKKQMILNSVELATLFHLPDQQSTHSSSVERQPSKQVDGPSKIPENGLLLGYNVYRGAKKEIRLSDEDRRRHLYIVGQTGTGKSVMLENLALQDMLDGRGFGFIDPHGDAVERLMSMVPKERIEDVIYFSPADMDYPLGLNLFEFHTPDEKDFLIQEAINMLYKLYDPQRQGIIGPRYEHLFRNAALTVMAGPDGGSFVDIPKLFNDRQYVNQKLKHVTDEVVRDFWLKEMPGSERSNEFGEVKSWFVSKFGAFLNNEMMRNVIGQTKSAFDLRQVMDDGKILFVNLSKGRTGELNSKLLGMIFVMKFQAAAMSRAAIPEEHRRDFSLYVDEFQNFSTDSFATILAESRKYHLNLIVANQFISQLSEEVRDAVFGNVGSVVSLRTGPTDADFLVKQFSPVFDTEDMVKLPNFNAVVRLMIDGVPSKPFSMATIPPLGHPNAQLGPALKRLSMAKYGHPREEVEKAIFARLKTPEPEFPGLGSSSPFGPSSMRPPVGPPKPPSPSPSFLDEWLAKRRSQPPTSTVKMPHADVSLDAEANPAQTAPVPQMTPMTDDEVLMHTPSSQPTDRKEPKIKLPSKSEKLKQTDIEEEAPTEFAKAKARGEIEKPKPQPKEEIVAVVPAELPPVDEPEPVDISSLPSPTEKQAEVNEITIDEEGNIIVAGGTGKEETPKTSTRAK